MIYKNYEISEKKNDFGFYEAYSLIDCDASMIYGTSIQIIKYEIDDLESMEQDSINSLNPTS